MKRLVVTIQERLDKRKCMKILCGLVENVCDNTSKVDYVIPETNYSWDKYFVAWCSLLLRNSTEAYSEPSLKHYSKAFLLKKLTALPEYIFYEVAGLTQPEFTCSKSTMQTSGVKSVQS